MDYITWAIWGCFVIASLFVSVHSMQTPTPKSEDEYMRMFPDMRKHALYPWFDHNFSQDQIWNLGTTYATRLRFAGLIGLILTLAITILTLLQFQLQSVFDLSTAYALSFEEFSKLAVSIFAYISTLVGLRIIEKKTWPFKNKDTRAQ